MQRAYILTLFFAQDRAEIKFGCQTQQGACNAAAIWHNKIHRKRRNSKQQAANTELNPLALRVKESNKEAQENALGNAAD